MKENNQTQQIYRSWQFWTTASILYLAIAFTLTSFFFPGFSFYLKAGQAAPFDIKSPVDREIIDTERTSELREEAASNTKEIYTRNPSVYDNFLKRWNSLFNAIEDINSSVDGPDTKRADALNEENEKNESMQFILSDTVLINIAVQH